MSITRLPDGVKILAIIDVDAAGIDSGRVAALARGRRKSVATVCNVQCVVDVRKRAYQPGDAPALSRLLNLIDVHAGGHAGWTEAEIDTMVSTLARDPDLDTAMFCAADGELVAAGVELSPPVGGFRIDLLGGVHPDWRGQGLGREILAIQLDRCAALHAAAGDQALSWEAHVGVMTGDEDAARLFRRFDLSPQRYWFEMVADTGKPVSAQLPEGLRVQTYNPEHEHAVYEAHVEAFRDHWGSQRRTHEEWVALTVGSTEFLPEQSVLAFDGPELVAYVLSYQEADPARLYIGHVGTRRSWRRRGVAAGLLGLVIAAAREAGYPQAELGVDADSPTGAVGVYERVGFAVESRAVTYTKVFAATTLLPAG